MAYTPTNWECGDVVTAEKLNKLEEAVEDLSIAVDGEDSGALVLRVDSTEQIPSGSTLCPNGGEKTNYDHTFQEVWNAVTDGRMCVLSTGDGSTGSIVYAHFVDIRLNGYTVNFVVYNIVGGSVNPAPIVLVADSADGALYEVSCNGGGEE